MPNETGGVAPTVTSPEIGEGTWGIHVWPNPGSLTPPADIDDIATGDSSSAVGKVYAWGLEAIPNSSLLMGEVHAITAPALWLGARQMEFKRSDPPLTTFLSCIREHCTGNAHSTVMQWTNFIVPYIKGTAAEGLAAPWISEFTNGLTTFQTWKILQSSETADLPFPSAPVGMLVRYLRSTLPASFVEVIFYRDEIWDPSGSKRIKLILQEEGDLYFGKRHDDFIELIGPSLIWVGISVYTLHTNE